ncbi:acetyl-CoA carboxylase biotin carboxyl carrier protein subunit [bacterium]|nr:acetyl-CoA carboxylase biotin carboxyl carrier protein subunit [bacterium]
MEGLWSRGGNALMLFYIRYREREYRVRVESKNQQLLVTFGDETEQPVDLTFFGNDCTFVSPEAVFSANVVGNKTDFVVSRPEGNLNFLVESEYRRIVGLLRGTELEQENIVYAKMPGKIVKMIKKVGDSVEKGESVMVMEAMKMENELRASISGKVQSVMVKEGQAVETGAVLMEISPQETT